MRVSDKGLLEIAEHEGIVPAPYRDSKGVWTFGIGHTAAAGGLDPREMKGAMPTDLNGAIDRAITIFREDVRKYEARVNAAITVPLAQHQFDALVSFDFNTGGIHRARLTQAINDRGPDAARHFMGWVKPPEIRKRRAAEMNLFRTGDYDANGDDIPVWRTDGKGNLKGILRTFDGAELLARMNRPNADWTPPPAREIAPQGGKGGAVAAGGGAVALGLAALWNWACDLSWVAWMFSSCTN